MIQRALAAYIPLGASESPNRVGQVVRQNLPQPAHQFGFRGPTKLRLFLVGVQQGLLNDIGRVQPCLIPPADVRSC